MSLRPDAWPATPLFAGCPSEDHSSGQSLSGAEGQLLALRIAIEPRLLEKLLDSLARLDFPINPEIDHHSALVYLYPDGREVVRPAATVEFPAYVRRLPEVRAALQAAGFDAAVLTAKNLLEGLNCDVEVVPAPPDSPCRKVMWYRYAPGSARGSAGAGQAVLAGAAGVGNAGSR